MSYIDLLASCVGTVFAEIITLPICTAKTNYQTNLQYKSMFDVYKNIFKTRGFYGFYSASLPAICSQVVSTSSKFTFYNYIKNYRNTQSNDIKNNVVNGAIGGICASMFSHPIDVVKIHQQNNISFMAELKKIGSPLIYRGYSKTLIRSIMVTSLIFPFYDFYKSKFANIFIASALSASTATIFLHPIDILKVRHISGQPLYLNFGNAKDNIKYYYRGIHINLMRVVPHFIITMFIAEKIKKHFADLHNNNQ